MKTKAFFRTVLIAGLAAATATAVGAPPTTSFTYQGSLAENDSPVDGSTSMQFKLWNAVSGGTQIGSTLSMTSTVTDGVFTESLDFGPASYAINQAMWLEIIVEGESMGLTPLSATPFSLNTRGIDVSTSGTASIRERLFLGADSQASTYGRYISSTGTWHSGTNNSGVGGTDNNHFYIWEGNQFRLSIAKGTGRFGIGTTAPATLLDVNGTATIREDMFLGTNIETETDIEYISSTGIWEVGTNDAGIGGTDSNQFYIFEPDTSAYRFTIQRGSGKVGIGTRSPMTMLDVNGAVTIRGGADIVEGFDSSCGTAFEPGTVLVIDPTNPGKLMCAQGQYDRKVAGVVSGANGVKPGIKLGQDGVMDGEIAVAMTGRVYAKCSTENGAIEPGDLLTTSSLRGHAMKATDRDLSHGAVIGKAMTALDESTGMVLVLVNLQ